MKVAISGPFRPSDIIAAGASNLPAGLPGTPVIDLIAALRRRDIDVIAVTGSPDLTDVWEWSEPGLQLRVVPYRGRARDRGLDYFKKERRAVAEAMPAAHEVDVVHAHWTYEFALAALQIDRKAIVTAHDSPWTVLRHQPHPYRWIRLAMAYDVRCRVTNLVVVSPYLCRKWNRHMLGPRALEVVPNIAPHLSAPGSRATDHPTIVTVGDDSQRKNIRRLLEAFAVVRLRQPRAELLLIGPGLAPDGELAQRSRHHEGISWLGPLSRQDVASTIGSSWLMVHPSLEETHGLSMLEAMSLGVPVIGGVKSGAVPWTLDGGRAGMLVDVRDHNSIARAAIAMIEDPGVRSRVGRAGESSARRFSEDMVVQSYIRLYERARR